MHVILGQVLSFETSPFVAPIEAAARHIRRGAVAIEAGKVAAVGEADAILAAHPGAERVDMGDALLSAGFIDCHVHYPQTGIIASWGKQLLDWLDTYTFPEEMRFGDAEYAEAQSKLYFDLSARNGTSSMCSFCTIHPESVDAFFAEAEARGQRVWAGKTCMDAHAPDGLRDTAQRSYDESKALMTRWHGVGRGSYVVTPRFSLTSSRDQLDSLGALWAEAPDCLMQTHLSEQKPEIARMHALFPEARDYLDTYEAHGLLGQRGIYGHAIHLEPREVDRLREMGAALAHCPTSNTFIGSGVFNMVARMGDVGRVGLATDTGGGSSFSMLRTMAAAYEIGQLSGAALHPAQLWWLATQGSAQALHAADKIGNLAPGMEADIIAVDLASSEVIAQRHARAESVWEALFPTIMMGDERAISAMWIAGARAF